MSTIRTVTRFLVPVVALVVAAGCGAGSASTGARSTTKALSGGEAGMVNACSTPNLAVWLGLGEGGAAAGSTFYSLELTNISRHRCRLFGFPGVSAVAGRQLGSPAQRNRTRRPSRVSLLPGETAHTVLQVVDVGNFPASRCAPQTATTLRVYPPNQRASAEIPFTFRACSAKGPIFLSVEPIQPGVGIPGR
jgi:hypothetical protein